MLGLGELVIPGLILLAIALFGSKMFLKTYRDWKNTRMAMKKIDEEFNQVNKEIKLEAK